MTLTTPVDDDHAEWERLPGEPTKAHAAFRVYRDMPAHQRRLEDVATNLDCNYRTVRLWAKQWSWRSRADAWDDACHRVEDAERLAAIRQMHAVHRRAGRAATVKAVQALSLIAPEDIPVAQAARLLELGSKLERTTLLVSVEELQGIEAGGDEEEDPWERIARELDPRSD